MLRKRIAIPVLSSCLCISMLPLQAFAAPSPIWNTTSTESPADTNTFQWDDDTKDDALTVFDTTDWSEFQDKLIYKETENSSAKADVSSEVRDLESSVKSILQDDNLQLKASLEYYKTDYTELVLAMIQVLAENCGVIGGDGENNSGKKFKQWLKNMGQFIVPGSAVGKKESITTLINAYAQSARAYKVKMRKDNSGKKDASISEPYIFDNDEALQAVIEGVVMHYGTTNFADIGYFYATDCNTNAAKPYTVKKARSYYKKHKTDIKAYYATCGDSDYEADPEFASNVSAIYSVSSGLGEDMSSYTAGTQVSSNEKVSAFLKKLAEQNGKPYRWGHKGPGEFDCSGLISYCLRESGAIPNFSYKTSSGMRSAFKVIPYSQVQPGDILWHPGHVMVYIKDGLTFEAKGRKYGVGFFKRNTASQTVLRWY